MEIKTKFSIGDKVMVMADPIIKTTCPFCKGKKSIEIDGETLYCQNCDGGVLKSRVLRRQLVEGVVVGIQIEVDTEEDEGVIIREDYCVDVIDNEKYWGDGTYCVDKIKSMEGESNE